MAANLTPQYLKAEENYRRATTPEEELKWLQIMFAEIPKHKASEKMQMMLKTKMSDVRKEMEQSRSAGKKGGAAKSFKIPRQGAGTCIVIGGPNAGKSQLLAAMTKARPEVAPYPFTTNAPMPGMMPWNDVFVQLIDTPPITPDFLEPYLLGYLRGADLVLLMLDLGDDDGITQCQDVLNRIAATKTRLARESGLDEDDVGLSYTKTFLVPNKIDVPDAEERLELFHELCSTNFDEFKISATEGTGLEELRDAIYKTMNVVRVYTKQPTQKEPDRDRPFTVRQGDTVLDLAEQIHKDYVEKFKFGRVWGEAVHDGTVVKGDYVIREGDVVEIHVAS
ncbi:MAG: TGS domain-containing protein [Planctomycetia bacterium]|nr:TGS domain-containing protein [Planctomycetia bacterium]